MSTENEERRAAIAARAEEERAALQNGMDAMKEGRGRLRLEKPISSGGGEIAELCFDFTALTGLDLAEAMDSGALGAREGFSYRQALGLFAKAAAKQTPALDMQDILARIGASDAAIGARLADIFFAASLRAGCRRISKL